MTTARREVGPLTRLGIDYGPLIAFFIVNFLFGGQPLTKVLIGTTVFMFASIAAMIFSKIRTGHISPMLWLSGVLVVVFGGLTLWFRDQTFIQVKPTIIYATFATILFYGLATGRPLLQSLLDTAYPGLTATGWRKLTLNWALFFVVLAVLNEVVRMTRSYDFWVGFKLWGTAPMTFLFAIANVPMLMRHGLTTAKPAVTELPPEG